MRKVKHFSLHRIQETELRVVADVENGVLPIIQEETEVIRGYIGEKLWPHRLVTLFILQDLQPLVRHVRAGSALPPGGAGALAYRPLVNAYDLADPDACHVFINKVAMVKEGYWDDTVAIRGLLAHEHAHPLAENSTLRFSRQLQMELSLRGPLSEFDASDSQFKVRELINLLAEKLCLYAPHEIFANELAIRSGFGDALFHLNRQGLESAIAGVKTGRDELRRRLKQQVEDGNLTPAGADLLLLVGDLKGHLDLALEVTPFYRAGRVDEAHKLNEMLTKSIFPYLVPQAFQAYVALQERYVTLRPDMNLPQVIEWSRDVLKILDNALSQKDVTLRYRLSSIANDE